MLLLHAHLSLKLSALRLDCVRVYLLVLRSSLIVLFVVDLPNEIVELLQLLSDKEAFGFSFANLHGIERVLLVQLNERLLQLDDFLVDVRDLHLNDLLLSLVF